MKRFIILVILISILSVRAMDGPVHNSDKICYLTLLPIEILDTIAYYVNIESDKELIERTQKLLRKPNPGDYTTMLPTFFEKHTDAILSRFSYNGKHVALLNVLYGDNILPELLIINTEKKEISHQERLAPLSYQHIAISNCGTLIATINEQRSWRTSYVHLNDSVEIITTTLTIQNLTNKETEKHFLNNLFWFIEDNPDFSFDFNKQQNKIIIHANCYESKMIDAKNIVSRNRNHIMIPVTINSSLSEPIKKTFDHFCKQKGVCKQFALTYLHKSAFKPILNSHSNS